MIIKNATDNEINKINKRLGTIADKLGTDSAMYKAYTDYFTVHGINTRTNAKGIVQIVRGKKANVSSIQMNNIEMLEYYGKLKRELKKRGEKTTKSYIEMVAYVKSKVDEIKEFVYLSTGKRHIDGLSGEKGKKTYKEMYNVLKKYEKDYERYKKEQYEELEDF